MLQQATQALICFCISLKHSVFKFHVSESFTPPLPCDFPSHNGSHQSWQCLYLCFRAQMNACHPFVHRIWTYKYVLKEVLALHPVILSMQTSGDLLTNVSHLAFSGFPESSHLYLLMFTHMLVIHTPSPSPSFDLVLLTWRGVWCRGLQFSASSDGLSEQIRDA